MFEFDFLQSKRVKSLIPLHLSALRRSALAALAAALTGLCAPGAVANDTGIINKGDAAVTAFSGTRRDGEVPQGSHPLDVTVIDTGKPSLQIFDLSKLGGPPASQLATAPSKFQVKSGDIGQVFGITLDGGTENAPPNIYAGASSLFGLQIVESGGKGAPLRLVKGAPNATWMPGQFGLGKGGGPGSIWKIDGKTGDVSLFSTITSGSFENAGPGLAGLAYDPVSQQIFAANLETGLIHRVDMSGRELGTFDHGLDARSQVGLDPVADDASKRMDILSPAFSIEDASTWGYANARRRVVALAVESGRLYYSVAEGPVVWSVGLTSTGDFGGDPRLEIDVTGTPNGNMITAIAFDGPEKLYLTQRGETAGAYDYGTFARPQESVVYRFVLDAGSKTWKEAAEEFAIGLEEPHRSTNGGIALNYGYDRDGNIDTAACNETLWTTGEHLRNGASASDPRTVHGLQGNSKTLAKPVSLPSARSGSSALNAGGAAPVSESTLEAPAETWFTDWDGYVEQDSSHGPIGQVAIFQKCNKRASSLPALERPLIPAVPKKPIPGIFVSKQCFPGLAGGVVSCRITVTNTGIAPDAPISISDTTTILAGPGTGTDVVITTFQPDAPDWICTPTPTTAFQCFLPARTVTPGQSRFVDVVVDTGPLTAAGNSGFRNCAMLDVPYDDMACTEFGDGSTGLVISKTGPAKCNPGTQCTFSLSVKNTGSLPFAGNAQISDAMFVAGASVPAPITASTLNCIGGNPVGLPFSCTVPLGLAPGASQIYSMSVTMPAAPPNYWAQNCFAAFDPAFVPPGGLLPSPGGPGGAGFGSPTNPACAWVAAGNPPPQSNLRITKTPVNGACDTSLINGLAGCHYQIRISNDGPTPFNNFVTLNEVTPVGSNLLLNPNWPCVAAAPGFNCTSPAAISIPPGGAFIVNATIQIPPLLTEPTCLVTNNVSIAAPLGAPQNIGAGDDASSATQSTALIAVLNPDGTVSVACDPTNLKTTKAVVSCSDAGANMKCTHSITVTNTGPDPYQGPINITDQYSAAPSDVSFPAGWNCNKAGSGFLCNKAGVQLSPPGKPGPNAITLEVSSTIPKGKSCSLRNTAVMTFPLSGTRFNQRGDDDQSSVSTPIPSPECSTKPTCDKPDRGEIASASGACVCDQGYSRDRDGRCQGEPQLQSSPEPQSSPDPTTCPDGNPIPRSGSCPCPSGENWNSETGSCEAACTPGDNEYRTSAGICLCKTGFERRGDACVDDRGGAPTPPVRLVPEVPERDACGYNETYASGRCVCRPGYGRDDGRCVKVRVEELCDPGPNEYRTANNRCVCREGFERRGRTCVPEREEATCRPGPNEFRTSRGYCLCREGYERDGRGYCIEEFNPVADCTRSGRIWTGRRCIDPPSPAEICDDRGGRWTGNRCDYGPTPKERCQMRGGRMIDGDCVFIIEQCPRGTEGRYPNCRKVDNDRPRPEAICVRDGGKWVRGECQYPRATTPREECLQSGGRWNSGKCERQTTIPKPAPSCGPHASRRGNECQCDPGFSYQDSNDCRPNTKPDTKPNDAKKCPAGTKGTYPDCKQIRDGDPDKKPLDDTPAIKPTPMKACVDRGGSFEEGKCVFDTKKPPVINDTTTKLPVPDQKPNDKQQKQNEKLQKQIEQQQKLQKQLEEKKQADKLKQNEKEQKKLKQQQDKALEQKKQLEKQQQKQNEKQQQQLNKQKQQLEKQLQKQQQQNQKLKDAAQKDNKSGNDQAGKDKANEKKDNKQKQEKNEKKDKPPGACPPGKFPNPAKGGKCTVPS